MIVQMFPFNAVEPFSRIRLAQCLFKKENGIDSTRITINEGDLSLMMDQGWNPTVLISNKDQMCIAGMLLDVDDELSPNKIILTTEPMQGCKL